MNTQPVFDDLLQEEREFQPSTEFALSAVAKDGVLYTRAQENYEKFWEDHARELDWFQPWHTVHQWTPPHTKWFLGGKINITHNCLDRHLKTPRRNKAALIWEGENGESRTLTYLQLHRDVCRFGNVL